MKVHILHIPKTGGISLFRALQGAGVDVTRSHDPAQVPPGALVVTLLRNPIDRAWSVYHYTVKKGQFEGTLQAFLQQVPDPWWWGVHNVQARYMRHGLMVSTTNMIDCTVVHLCTLAGVAVPDEITWHGQGNHPDYTTREYAQLAAAVGAEDMALYRIVERGW